jgi:hypothetical protein
MIKEERGNERTTEREKNDDEEEKNARRNKKNRIGHKHAVRTENGRSTTLLVEMQ